MHIEHRQKGEDKMEFFIEILSTLLIAMGGGALSIDFICFILLLVIDFDAPSEITRPVAISAVLGLICLAIGTLLLEVC